MSSQEKRCKGCFLPTCEIGCKLYREAADRICEMANEYEGLGLHDLSAELKDICSQIHFLARQKQMSSKK